MPEHLVRGFIHSLNRPALTSVDIIVIIAIGGICLPFGLGIGVAVPLYHQFVESYNPSFPHFMLFVGVVSLPSKPLTSVKPDLSFDLAGLLNHGVPRLVSYFDRAEDAGRRHWRRCAERGSRQ